MTASRRVCALLAYCSRLLLLFSKQPYSIQFPISSCTWLPVLPKKLHDTSQHAGGTYIPKSGVLIPFSGPLLLDKSALDPFYYFTFDPTAGQLCMYDIVGLLGSS